VKYNSCESLISKVVKIYQDKVKTYDAELLELDKTLNRIPFLRLFVFVFSAAILIVLVNLKLFLPFFIVFPIAVVCFGLVLNRHSRLDYLKKHASFLKKINESEILRQESNLEEFDTGEKFINHNHPYTSDLDIFGQYSVFQLVNRTTTESGMSQLAEWLSKPASNHEILERQLAIKELSQKLDWQQTFQAAGMHFQNKKSDYYQLMGWVEAPLVLFKNRHLYMAAAILLAIVLLVGLVFLFINWDSPKWFLYILPLLLVWFVNSMILRKVEDVAEAIVETSTKNLKTLRGYQALIDKIENESFQSEKLCKLQAVLLHGEYSAHREIERICRILKFSHQRSIKGQAINGNALYSLFNQFFLFDIYLIISAEKWKSKNKAFLKQWSDVVSEFEVINSLAGFCHANPSYTFPEITEKKNYIHFESLGHPIINSQNRVCNDFRSEGKGAITLITGSNMGGKSTFLRTVGVNLVLALAGAPCCAIYGEVSNLNLFTSMRTQDNLQGGISSFYAELNRIEKMLNLINGSDNVFFLLDEIFKGTNSEDRHKGGFSLINQISKLNTSGIIATHDIELAKLSENKSLVKNYSFNSEIIDNSMYFSYELHPGVCIDFNATELMKNIGIEIISDASY
jgi:Flp pilus assembly protein TadB